MAEKPLRISGHHLGAVALYFYNIYGNEEREIAHLGGYFIKNVDKVRELYEKLKKGAQFLVVAEADDICGFCAPVHHWQCRDSKGDYNLVERDTKSAADNGFEIGEKVYSLDHILERFAYLKK